MTRNKSLDSETTIKPGQRIAGRYRIQRLIGHGGMGIVFLAKHEAVGQLVALKVLNESAAGDEANVQRFLKEARASARIWRSVSSAWVRCRRPRCAATCSTPFTRSRRRTPWASCTVLKVLDFGIAKMDEGESTSGVTSTGTIMGTPAYMAPEQMRSTRSVDARADVWALGVIAYELMSGQLPYPGESLGDILVAVIRCRPPSTASPRSPRPARSPSPRWRRSERCARPGTASIR